MEFYYSSFWNKKELLVTTEKSMIPSGKILNNVDEINMKKNDVDILGHRVKNQNFKAQL